MLLFSTIRFPTFILDVFPAAQKRKQKVSSHVLLALQILCLNLTASLWQYNCTTTKQPDKLHNINFILCTKRCTLDILLYTLTSIPYSLYTLHSTLQTPSSSIDTL